MVDVSFETWASIREGYPGVGSGTVGVQVEDRDTQTEKTCKVPSP